MMQETMQRMTGRGAVSLQEATDDPRAQRAFLVQRGLMQQMTGIGDTGELNRLLEVMSKAELGTGQSVDAQNALSEAMQNGQDIASKQTDIMATVSENMKSLESTLVATNELYREYIDTVTARGAGVDIMQTRFAAQTMERQGRGIEFTRQDLTGEATEQLMESTAVDMLKSYTTSFVDQVTVGGGIVKNALAEFSEGLQSTGNEDLVNFGETIRSVTSDMGNFGTFYNTMKENIDRDFGYGSATGMPNIQDIPAVAYETQKVEVEPIKMTLDLNINDEEGNTVVSKVYEIVSTAMNRISRGD
jgi:hypothetical protein